MRVPSLLLLVALAAACAEREARTVTSAASTLPPLDRDAPGETRTATFALG